MVVVNTFNLSTQEADLWVQDQSGLQSKFQESYAEKHCLKIKEGRQAGRPALKLLLTFFWDGSPVPQENFKITWAEDNPSPTFAVLASQAHATTPGLCEAPEWTRLHT